MAAVSSPLLIPGCQLWLDASDLSTLFDATVGGSLVTTNGAAVARWEDKSGNGRHFAQSTSGDRPRLNTLSRYNKAGLFFDGNDRMSLSSVPLLPSGNANLSILAVYMPRKAADIVGSGHLFGNYPDGNFGIYQGNQYPYATPWGVYNGTLIDADSGPYVPFVPRNITTIRNTGQWFNFTNGVQKNTVANSQSLYFGAGTSSTWFIGGASYGDFSVIDMCELLVYSTALTTAQRQSVEGYLMDKWGIPLAINSPNDIDSCQLWLDASDTSTLAMATSAVRTNLLTYSEDFDNTANWTANNITSRTANITASPFGLMTADLITENTSAGAHGIYQGRTTYAAGVYTASVYLKYHSKQFASVSVYSGTSGATRVGVTLDLTTGTVTQVNTLGTPGLSSFSVDATYASQGWYRVTATMQCSAVSNSTGIVINLSNTGTPTSFVASTLDPSYTGTSGAMFIYGAQFEAGSVATPYLYSGPVSNSVFRPLSGKNVTNLLTYSEDLGNGAWTKENNTVTVNVSASPIGTLSADKLFETITALPSAHRIYGTITNISQHIPLTFSVYVKQAERQYVQLALEMTNNTFSTIFDVTSGVGVVSASRVLGAASLSASTITHVGSGWYRCSITGTLASTSSTGTVYSVINPTNRLDYSTPLSFSNQYPAHIGSSLSGILIWGAQLEYGSLSTYVSTGSSTATVLITSDPLIDNSLIAHWINKSLNSSVSGINDFTDVGGSVATRPIYKTNIQNNYGVVRFNGISQYLTDYFNGTNYTSQTVFVVAPLGTSTAGWDRYYTQNSSAVADYTTGSGHYMPIIRNTTTQTVGSYANGIAVSTFTPRGAVVADIMTSTHTGSAIQCFLNGYPSSSTYTHSLNYNVVMSRLGANFDSTIASYLRGDIAEVIVYKQCLSLTERQAVENYLARKWNLPRTVRALQSGNWYDTNTWSINAESSSFNVPISTDDVYTNSFNIIISSSVIAQSLNTLNILSLTGTVLSAAFLSGGTFNITQPLNVVTLSGIRAGNTTCIVDYVSSGTVSITGNVAAGNFTDVNGIINLSGGNVTVFGNVSGGAGLNANGLLNPSGGNISIIGNITGGSNTNANGVNSLSSNNISIIGNITGGSNSTAYGILNTQNNTASISGNITGNTGTGLWNNSTSNTSVSGNITGGSAAASYGAINNNTGNLTITGNILGGTNSTAYGVINNSTGNLTIVGNISGSGSTTGVISNNTGNVYITAPSIIRGGSAAGCCGVSNSNYGVVYINGNCLGGTNSTAYAVQTTTTGVTLITGTVTGNTGAAVSNSSTGILIINGGVVASANSAGVVGSGNINVAGSIINNTNGRQAMYVPGYTVKPKGGSSLTTHAVEGTGTMITYYGLDSFLGMPPASSVRAGVSYAGISTLSGIAVNIPDQYIGTMNVPPPSNVAFGVPVENTIGVCVNSPTALQRLWNISLDNIKSKDSLGSRLKNTATISDVGELFAYGSLTTTPDKIAGLQLWLDATVGLLDFAGSPATTNGTAVATWQDRSGNNRHATQSTSSARPTLLTSNLNNKNCVFFDGTDWMKGISFPNLINYTMFAVYKRKGTPSSGSGFVFCTGVDGNSTDTARLTQLIYHDSTVNPPGYNAFGWPVKVTASNSLDVHIPRNDNFNIHSCTASLTNGTGQYILNSTGASNSISFTPVSTAIGSMIYTLGTKTWGQTETAFLANCDIAEIIVYNTALTVAQRQAIELYLNLKWGIY